MFEVIPAVDLKSGKCVQLVQGVPGSEVISYDNPVEVAKNWIKKGAKILHIIDLDGAIEGKRINAPIIREIRKECDAIIQVGGGIRSYKDVADLLEIGIDRVILGTSAINKPSLVKDLVHDFGGDHVMVALDAKKGKVAIMGWSKQSGFKPVDLAKKFENIGIGSILFTNIDTEGLLQGINPEPTKEIVNAVDIPVIAAGGITTLEDIQTIKKTGAYGVVIGTALYIGKFALEEAIKLAEF
ncbi:MAG TPA: 1-(5-phosphoribosyl)-5-[(5-phosphoribosylamino)methylideneamino]imidazole-4-carboxamide isomerase [Methanosarcinales archaeon]|nr:1-(5-phosphoribosyl)-5-[(5-phosphoribosylamino)methylideneamino]imidazole-4-carboxamide isomerase [Methanosarcinales archaeon]